MTISSNVNVNVRQFHTYSNLHVYRKYLFKVCFRVCFNPTFVCFLFVAYTRVYEPVPIQPYLK